MIWAIAMGGAFGAVLRFVVITAVDALMGKSFPLGTLSVNVIGSFVAGLCVVLLGERWSINPEVRGFIMVGLLGGFTTFSAFSVENLAFILDSQILKALAYASISVSVCLCAAWLGSVCARLV